MNELLDDESHQTAIGEHEYAPAGENRRETPLIVGNWKTQKSSREGALFIQELVEKLGGIPPRDVVVAQSFPGLLEAVEAAQGTRISVAAQNMSSEEESALTGAVPARMLLDLGVRAVIIGHSEHSQEWSGSNEALRNRVRCALDHGLLPIVCVGDTASERSDGLGNWSLFRQLWSALAAVHPWEAGKIAVVYEPVWAAARGGQSTPEDAQEAVGFIRCCVAEALGPAAAAASRLLFGGHVDAANIDELMTQPDIDGVLVEGDACLDSEVFAQIVRFNEGASGMRQDDDPRNERDGDLVLAMTLDRI